MRVLLIAGSYPPMKCGSGDYTAQLAGALGKRQDIKVAVLTSVAADAKHATPNVEVFPVIQGWKISDISRIFKIIRDWHPNIVHMQFGSIGYRLKVLPWLFPTLLRLRNLQVVQTWHEYSGDPLRVLRNLPNAVISGGLVVVKPDFKNMMPGWYRWLIRHKQFRYIPNASAIPKIQLSDAERSAIHSRFAAAPDSLVSFFGFANPRKGVEAVFDIADPKRNSLALICELNPLNPYHKLLLERINHGPWTGKVTVTGFLPPDEVARILAAADAVVLPFPDGVGVWSTSAQAAMFQGTFVLATSRERHGYDSAENVYYANPGDIADMQQALFSYIGRKNDSVKNYADWDLIAGAHIQLYSDVLNGAQQRMKIKRNNI